MSEEFFYSKFSQSHINYSFNQVQPGKMDNTNSFVPRNIILWDEGLSMEILSFFTKLSPPFRNYLDIPFQDPLRSEIRRFLLSLDAYLDSPNPVIPYRDILYGATKRDFAESLKRIKRKSFSLQWRVELYDTPEWWDNTPSYPIQDIGDIFNYSYTIFWSQEDDKDYLNGLIPVEIDTDYLAKFKIYVASLLPERTSFDLIDPISVRSRLDSSMSLQRGTFKHIPHYKNKTNLTNFSRVRRICDRVLIPVSPANIRDSVLLDPEDLNTISLLDQQIMNIIEKIPSHIHIRDKDKITKRLNCLYDDYFFFIQRDIKKEGITKPKELLKVILEALHEAYPDIAIFEYTSFYDNYSLRVEGEIIDMKRGHGLGMANSMTTLMNLAIHRMILDELEDDIPGIDSDCLTINDDFVVGFKDEYHLDSYWEKEQEIMDFLSIIREPKKSFSSRNNFVIAERYMIHKGEYEKVSYQLRELLLPLACANITHAKEYFISLQSYVNSNLVEKYMEEIKSFWGYEFFPEEFSYPHIVGGWLNPKLSHVDLSLCMLENMRYNTLVGRGFKACTEKLYIPRKGINFTPPLVKLLGDPYIPSEYKEVLNIAPLSYLNHKFGRVIRRSDTNFRKYWDDLYQLRQKTFKRSFFISFEDLIIEILNHYSNIDFLPSEFMIYKFHPVNYIQVNIADIYIDPNPIMSMVAKFNTYVSYPYKEEFSIHFSDRDHFDKRLSGLFSKEVERALKSERIGNFFTGTHHQVSYPSDGYQPQEDYLNPINIGLASTYIYGARGYPEIKPIYRNKLLDKKKEVFGLLFSIEEQMILSSFNLSHELLKVVVDFIIENRMPLEEFSEFFFNEINPSLSVYSQPYIEYIEEENESIDNNIEPINTDGKIRITLSKIIQDESIFWGYYNNQEDYILPEGEEGREISKLSFWAQFLSQPVADWRVKQRDEIRDMIMNPSRDIKVISMIAHTLGLLDLPRDQLADLPEGEELFGALFGED